MTGKTYFYSKAESETYRREIFSLPEAGLFPLTLMVWAFFQIIKTGRKWMTAHEMLAGQVADGFYYHHMECALDVGTELGFFTCARAPDGTKGFKINVEQDLTFLSAVCHSQRSEFLGAYIEMHQARLRAIEIDREEKEAEKKTEKSA